MVSVFCFSSALSVRNSSASFLSSAFSASSSETLSWSLLVSSLPACKEKKRQETGCERDLFQYREEKQFRMVQMSGITKSSIKRYVGYY